MSSKKKPMDLPQVLPCELRRYRQLYQVYQQIWQSVTAESIEAAGLTAMLPFAHPLPSPIRETVSPELEMAGEMERCIAQIGKEVGA